MINRVHGLNALSPQAFALADEWESDQEVDHAGEPVEWLEHAVSIAIDPADVIFAVSEQRR